jgi:hypothetical protein
MRRLTLILSDLYLPAERQPGGEFPQTDELPELSWLLSHASRPEHIGDWRRWLLWQVGGQLVEIPQAAICAYERLSGAKAETAWLATPVSLEARLDHVRMMDRGLLHLDADERTAWCAEFNRTFGPEYSLHDCGERAFVLSGLNGSATVPDPARLLGDEIGPSLPGAATPELRRLWAEIEMWLHGSALNDARERARKRRISALWLWGRTADPRGSRGTDQRDLEIYGGDPLITGLSRMRQAPLRGVPNALAQIEGSRQHVIAEFAVLTGPPQESLAAVDSGWFAAARHALENGALASLDIVVNDSCFRISPRARWRIWRRRRGWLEILAYQPESPKA